MLQEHLTRLDELQLILKGFEGNTMLITMSPKTQCVTFKVEDVGLSINLANEDAIDSLKQAVINSIKYITSTLKFEMDQINKNLEGK